ncbi:acyl-CoA synthetase [Mycolicibacterium monacense]|uniref:Long-chain-fatty-acid--CoA ligase FadD13 n=1 Tax=Mycolicibacterium monacense TaxID=85693 RepID=A0AAD1IXN7_MYCMB|nr:long-chain fatty acid--CoA ligase [Mycolicibacterium monacense]MDA4103936.1 fatty-acid--CoA ligase [Mycolicibacterium monacense DSM 44395]ORB23178.1 fatty-acid--CoA ligase [Mycolicibacterium monacense DSM 44395]QHP85271.1 long-chain-fatty-acid--CoA ligase [Mycolicibacterium monacense DSM 44395]BBZ61875.1 fatty-acid--CoA ligase [Mycolicibacterium monacense]
MYLTQALHRAVQQTPDLPATVFGERVRTWAQTADRAARLASAFQGLGVRSGDRVALLAQNCDAYHDFLFAVPWADGVAVPVNTRWSVHEIAFSLEDAGALVLVVDDVFLDMVEELRELAPTVQAYIHVGDRARPEGVLDFEDIITAHDPIEDARRGGDALAAIYYTGGTTGTPKGVMLSHANLMAAALGALSTGQFLEPRGRLLHSAPMFHLADGSGWLARNLVGGTHVILPGFTPDAVAVAVERYQITDMFLAPTMIQMFVDSPAAAQHDLSSLKHLIYGASPISQAVLERAMRLLPQVKLLQAYGMTELSPTTTVLTGEEHLDPALLRSAGRAVPIAEVKIVDEDDNEVPRGTVGEVAARGPHVMLGYWNRPEETAQALRGGWMHTGDGGYLDDNGYLFIVDRIKDMIVTGGENVYSAEVENALAQHASVATCAVIGVPDADWGERVHAVVVLQEGMTATAQELRDHCGSLIARYKAPRTVDFVDSLPLTAAAKVSKVDLRQRYWKDASRSVN